MATISDLCGACLVNVYAGRDSGKKRIGERAGWAREPLVDLSARLPPKGCTPTDTSDDGQEANLLLGIVLPELPLADEAVQLHRRRVPGDALGLGDLLRRAEAGTTFQPQEPASSAGTRTTRLKSAPP